MKDTLTKHKPAPEPEQAPAPPDPVTPMPTEIRTGDSVEIDAAGNVVAVNGKPVTGEA